MSLEIALTGLDATNRQLNTISNNIANASTTGFKKSRTEFSAVYNGIQQGGVEVASTSQNFDKTGSITGTGRSLDLAIDGEGFFVTRDTAGQTLYTRSGIFGTNKDNFIVSNTGAKLQGYGIDPTSGKLNPGAIGDLKISEASLAAKATTSIDFVSNFDARAKVIPATPAFDPSNTDTFNSSYTSKVYDSLGNPHTVTQYFSKTAANSWTINVQIDGAATPAATQNVTFNTSGKLTAPTAPFNVAFNPTSADPMSVGINLNGTTQFGSDFSVTTNSPNGYSAGDLTGIRVEDNGYVYASYSNGQSLIQGQVALADFTNPQGLVKTNGTSWMQSYSSGAPVVGSPGSGTLGGLTPGALEGSNVDLTNEMVGMMTAQRNYQANAKTISTSDQLMQSLFNAI